jgi:hypothetical protein
MPARTRRTSQQIRYVIADGGPFLFVAAAVRF